jgi:hypothetical protein
MSESFDASGPTRLVEIPDLDDLVETSRVQPIADMTKAYVGYSYVKFRIYRVACAFERILACFGSFGSWSGSVCLIIPDEEDMVRLYGIWR